MARWLALLAVCQVVLRGQALAAGKGPYDYIIVGGGTAGLAVATRLSLGLPGASILVIEAGPAAPDELGINVPGRKGSTLGTRYDWNFTTVPQPGALNRTIPANRGHVLGGSSALNLMCYDRAAAAEYDAWGDVGATGWGWASMSAAMMKSENVTGSNSTCCTAGVGTQGPVRAVVNRIVPPHQMLWAPTVETFGVPENDESLDGNPIGVVVQPSSVDATHYNRSYSANAYLPLAGPNLKVLTNTRVVKINFEKKGGLQSATAVTLSDGTLILVSKEVIVSAGTIQSPGLLELSGIGQASTLASINTTQVVDLPGVGENLQDHIRVQASYQLLDNYTSFDALRNATFAAAELQKWLAGQVSLYDYTASAYIFADWPTVLGEEASANLTALARGAVGNSSNVVDKKKLAYLGDRSVPQLEVIFSDGYTGIKGYPAAGSPLSGKGFFTLIPALMHPLSRGSVHINATDPLGKPIIDPNYLDNEYDIQALVAGIKLCRAIASAEPLRSAWVAEYEPGLDAVQTDAEWRQYVLNNVLTVYHPVGTCAMLPRGEGGVVDAELRVYGTANLRVADASVIPVQVSAHIQTAVYGIAERAAEMIIADDKKW